MTSRRAKRKRYVEIEDVLVSKLQSLNLTSSDLNNDILAANEDFGLLYKSMEDRHSELYSRMLGIAEKHMEINYLIKDGNQADVGGSSTEVPFIFPEEYNENVRRFVEDAGNSMNGNAKMLKEQTFDMSAMFQTFVESWTQKLQDLKDQADVVAGEKEKVRALLSDFVRNV